MRIGLTADLHLGKALGPRTDALGVNLRSRDLEAAFSQVVDGFIRNRVEAVVIAGDLFEKPKPPEFVRQFLVRELLRLEAGLPGVPKLILRGNHDATAHFGTEATAVGTAALALPGPDFIVADAYEPRVVDLGTVVITLVPWMRTDAEFVSAIENLDPPPGRCNILVLHAGLADLPEYSEMRPGSQTLTRALVPVDRYAAIFSGHYHMHHVFPDLRWTFIGSPERLSSTESRSPKGYLIYDTDSGQTSFHGITTRPWYDLERIDAHEWDGTRLIAELEKLRASLPDWDQALVWATFEHLRPEVYAALDVAAIRAIRASCFAEKIVFRADDTLFPGTDSALDGPLLDDLATEWTRHLDTLSGYDPAKLARIRRLGDEALARAAAPEGAAEPSVPAG
jgi:DNA repair exonuclease SbcCD nuclease subunit